MVKKKQRKASAIARSELTFKGSKNFLRVKESYRLIKIRLLDINDFVEVTPTGQKKMIINKSTIARVHPLI